MRNLHFLYAFVATASACSPVSHRALNKVFESTETRFQDNTGFVLYDPSTKETLYDYNGAKYFTPASNTKIFTLFASLCVLGDSIPALKYTVNGDSLTFWGTGDPSFLYEEVFDNGRVYNFLRNRPEQLYFSPGNFHTSRFGSGWAWDDYNDYYSTERSSLPVYGNVFTVRLSDSHIDVLPNTMRRFMTVGDFGDRPVVTRDVDSNHYTVLASVGQSVTRRIPFNLDALYFCELLSDTLQREVRQVVRPVPRGASVLYSVPSDSLYKVMMQDSDNFIAEQLLLMCASLLSDSLSTDIAIEHVKKNLLADLVDEPNWVDGSGLSRYNLFTPRSIVQLWEKILYMVPRERLFALLAVGGKSGTIRNWYAKEEPFIYGKTGSLSNQHCVSGYLLTRKGKTLIFSFMNGNFTAPGNEIRRNMQAILNVIYDNY
jgi:D-alanyl-D-alanine carboxypeptidase/D-alanyl-D-alanine-endopeptidase (penicillin-binding protein 4)